MKPIPIICGPTASGKTAAALALADTYPLEIVSADSRQIIKYLDIGTAKPSAEELSRVPTHLINLIEPGERYSAFQYITDAVRVIKDIFERDKLPVVVGGTGLYMRALSEGVVEIEDDDLALRERLEKEMDALGSEKMYEKLENIDPLEAARIHPHNKKRVIRALEIYYLTGKTKSELIVTGAYKKSEYAFDYLCLAPQRDLLYDIINARVDAMLAAGWRDEVERLVRKIGAEKIRKANVIGYNELLDCLEGNLSTEEAVLLIKQNTRRYAKRQLTWFRKQKACRFFPDIENLKKALAQILYPGL
ncbi:MAG: tRNA (adenosine(37)-N6)-dimethylallyltransferase MiaA [candidate division Zixibacteria bacterium]|nr:tRNA (adenosine(37)-N6)-dimethylallyltransferase MiaA [candidate division Zixibacteria bacterium]